MSCIAADFCRAICDAKEVFCFLGFLSIVSIDEGDSQRVVAVERVGVFHFDKVASAFPFRIGSKGQPPNSFLGRYREVSLIKFTVVVKPPNSRVIWRHFAGVFTIP